MKETLDLPFSKYFHSGAFGSGLAILSRFPIISSTYHRYTLNGKPLKIFHGDYYVGKGAGAVVLKHPQLGNINVFNTHLHAGYGDGYKAHRAAECWELAEWVRQCQGPVIVTGDFNSTPTSLNYTLIRDHGLLEDSWTNPEPGITCNSPFNTFSPNYQKGDATLGKRLDYIFHRQLNCIQSTLVMTELIPGQNMSYSDHFGVSASFDILQTSNLSTKTRLDKQIIRSLLDLLVQESLSAKRDANRLIGCLFFSLLLLLFFFPLSIFLPTLFRQSLHGDLATILVPLLCDLLIMLCSILATLCLIVGLVFGNTEQKALLELTENIQHLAYDN
ncbi:unnamed protein product [Rhizopus stolonifer]